MSTSHSLLSQSTYRAGLLQSQAYRALSSFMTAQLEPFRLSLPEWALLGHLSHSDGLRPSDVSKLLSVKRPVATRLIASLEGKSLLCRAAHPADSRASIIKTTPEGQRLVVTIESTLRAEMRGFLADVTLEELAVYVRVLEKIAAKG